MAATCQRMGYYPDGGSGLVTYSCPKCEATDELASDASSDEKKAASDSTTRQPATPAADNTGSSTANGTGASSSDGGCSVGSGDVGSGLALLALLIPALPLVRRRKKR